jgi:hypothetical protein
MPGPIATIGTTEVSLRHFSDGSHVRPVQNEQFAPEFSQQGVNFATTQNYRSKLWPNLSRGLTRDRIDSDSHDKIDEYRHFWDCVGLDTRWPAGVWLSPLASDPSQVAEDEVLRASAHFKGEFWTLWDHDTGSSTFSAACRKFDASGPSWGNGGLLFAAQGNQVIGLDIVADGTHLVALVAHSDDHLIYRSTDGASWAAASVGPTPGLLADSVTANETAFFGKLIKIGGELVAVLWDEDSGSITCFSSTDAGDNWADEGTGTPALDIPTSVGVRGVAVYTDIDDLDHLFVGTDTGLWSIDVSPAAWTFRSIDLTLPVHPNNCLGMVVHNGGLMYSVGVPNTRPTEIRRLTTANGALDIESGWGLNVGDGVPSDLMGLCRDMVSSGEFLYMSVSGDGAGRTARVLCHNGEGWHHMYQWTTEAEQIEWIDISSESDGVERLHMAPRAASDDSDALFLPYPNVNPTALTGTINRVTEGYVDLPWIDAGLPLDPKRLDRVRINARDLAATASTNNYINVDYAVATDLGARTERGSFAELGDYLSGVSSISLGTDGVGVSFNAMALRINLLQEDGTITDSPVALDIQVDYEPRLPATREYEMLIDMQESADILDGGTPASVRSELETLEDTVTKIAFTYADLGTKYGKIRINYSDKIINDDEGNAPDSNASRAGVAHAFFKVVP